ncbi:MAG: hypothetical protein ACQEP5_06890 [Actinomycetota bacterium]
MEKEDEIYCPVCAKPIKPGVDICPHCQTIIEDVPTDRLPLEHYPSTENFEYGKTRFAVWIIVGIIIIILASAAFYFIVSLR